MTQPTGCQELTGLARLTKVQSMKPAIPPDLFAQALALPSAAGCYFVTEQLIKTFPDCSLVEGSDSDFDLNRYLWGEKPQHTLQSLPTPIFDYTFNGSNRSYWSGLQSGWLEVHWGGQPVQVFMLTQQTSCGAETHYWLLAPQKQDALGLFLEVCDWSNRLRDEVMVFQNGHWGKSAELFKSIKGATLDNLVLEAGLKEEIRQDFERFLRSQETYGRYGIPWKRGILLIGPPGNGKTHTVKALINHLGVHCLYVKSFQSRYHPPQASVQAAFQKAREMTPCILVMEDLDSLINDETRSFFLNELDGFADNHGVFLVATTNHPERLDPAILDRPSRFDRKYHFRLPKQQERLGFVQLWNARLEEPLRLKPAQMKRLAAATDGFSFAYLRELFLSSMMAWFDAGQHKSMAQIMDTTVKILEQQRQSGFAAQEEAPPIAAED